MTEETKKQMVYGEVNAQILKRFVFQWVCPACNETMTVEDPRGVEFMQKGNSMPVNGCKNPMCAGVKEGYEVSLSLIDTGSKDPQRLIEPNSGPNRAQRRALEANPKLVES